MCKNSIVRSSFWLVLALLSASVQAAIVVAPIELTPGSSVSPLPNGFSSGDGIAATKPFDHTWSFSFANGPSGTLRERVLDYADRPSVNHPGLYFDFEIQLSSGTLAAFAITGYSNFNTFVKVCGISGCGGSGANGLAPTSATRSSNGDQIRFDFGTLLTAGDHSANLQIFTDASLFRDPPAFFIDTSGNSFSIDVVAPAAVPEPPIWAMLLLGIAGLGLRAARWKSP